MDATGFRRHLRPLCLATALAALFTVFPSPAPAAVAILSEEDAPVLVLIDADRLDTPLLARLVTAGFSSPHRFETGCEVVDAGLLADRLKQAKRIVAVLSTADTGLVQELLLGSAAVLRNEASAELRALRDAMGEAAQGLSSLEAGAPVKAGAP